jgi:tetratricopeptide (TPR) repeat protein
MKHFQKMTYLVLISIIGTVQILTMTVPRSCEAFSELLKSRRELQRTPSAAFTRLIFELKGERPTEMTSRSPHEFVISFGELRSKLAQQNVVPDTASTVAAITILDVGKGSQILIQLRSGDSPIKHSFQPPQSSTQGPYRLLVDVLPPVKKQASDDTGKGLKSVVAPGQKPQHPVEAATVKQDLQEPRYKEVAEANLSEPLKKANGLFGKGNYEEAFNDYSRLLNKAILSKDEVPLALYGLADSYYSIHQQDLPVVAQNVIDYYLSAIKAEPLATQAAWAYYRCGLASQAAGDHKSAIEAFQKAIHDYPKHPALPLCWVGLGHSYQQTASHAQAITAVRTALELPLDQPQKAKAYWLLGAAHYANGEYASAIDALELRLKEDPHWYREQPLILKYLGESYFVQKQYNKSRDCLLRYLNLQSETSNKDLTLALIAELFTLQGEEAHASKLYHYIQNYYPDSEGDVIAQIRTADFLKSKDRIAPQADLDIFRELAQKPLPPQLSKLVRFKLASREHEYGNYEESLITIDSIQEGSTGTTPNNEWLVLRSKVIRDWLKHAFNNQDCEKVIHLYESNQDLFADINTPELSFMIAESYTRMRQYSKAIAHYEQILAKKGVKEEEGILFRMAECYFQAEELGSAISLCTQIKGTPFKHKKAELLAQIHFTQHEYAKVIECLGSLPERDISATCSPELSGIYGESLFQVGDCEKALPWLQQASSQLANAGRHDDELIHSYVIQAACYTKLKKYDLAIAILEDASKISSTENQKNQLTYDISKNLLELGQKDKAIQTLTKLMNSTQGFWQTAAKQQLDYVQMQHKGP